MDRWLAQTNVSASKTRKDLAFLAFLIETASPFELVNNGWLHKYLQESNVEPTTVNHVVTHLLPVVHLLVIRNIQKELSDVDFISVTSDGWTDPSLRGFVSITDQPRSNMVELILFGIRRTIVMDQRGHAVRDNKDAI